MNVESSAIAHSKPAEPRLKMAVLAFEGVRPFQLSVPCEIFAEPHSAGERTEMRVCSVDRGSIRTSAGFEIETSYGLDDLASADVIFIPSWKMPHEKPSSDLVDALQAASAKGSITVGLCLGAFVLAEAGLLNDRHATTHWAFAQEFRDRFPDVQLEEEQLFVDEGNVVTSAGVAAGVDCCLHLASRFFGAQYANRIARNIVAAPHRVGGQMQFIDRPMAANNRDMRLREAMDDVVQTIAHKHTIDAVAQRMAMSRRNFTRHFQQTMGISFSDWLADERLALAARALEATSRSVDQIAIETGFGSAATLRVRFAERFGVSPTQWRKAFHKNGSLPVL